MELYVHIKGNGQKVKIVVAGKWMIIFKVVKFEIFLYFLTIKL